MPEDPKKEFLAQIEATTEPYLKSVLERVYREQIDVENSPTLETKISDIKQKITTSAPEEIVYSFLPHEMAKIPDYPCGFSGRRRRFLSLSFFGNTAGF